jgi:hypothetical protein
METLIDLLLEKCLDGAQPFGVHGADLRFHRHCGLVHRLRG